VERINEPIIVDDCDILFSDKACTPLLKSLLETREKKRVSWLTLAATRAGLPQDFETESRVVLIFNKWDSNDANMKAIEDRCNYYHFCPSAQEVHKHLSEGGWFNDSIVISYIETQLKYIPHPSLRNYEHVRELRDNFKDWKDKAKYILCPEWDSYAVVVDLLGDASFKTEADR